MVSCYPIETQFLWFNALPCPVEAQAVSQDIMGGRYAEFFVVAAIMDVMTHFSAPWMSKYYSRMINDYF